MNKLSSERGAGLITVLMIMGLVLALATALSVRIQLDTRGQASFQTTPQNLSVAEAGVAQGNAQFRNIFVSGNIPVGTTGNPPATDGTGDYALQTSSLGGKPIRYELTVPPGVTNPTSKRLPAGVQFGGLNVAQSLYTVVSGTPDLVNPAAQLRSEFQVSDIPTFQFLAFYDGQLDISPAQDMTLHGRIHSDANLYLDDSAGTLTVDRSLPNIPAVEISSSGNIFRTRSDGNGCNGTVRIADNTGTLRTLTCAQGPQVSAATLANWGGTMLRGVQNITLPPLYATGRLAPQGFWAVADLRIVLDVTNKNFNGTRGATTVNLFPIVVQNVDGSVNAAKTTALRNFMRASTGSIFYNDVPVTTDGGSTSCETRATQYVNPTYAPPVCGTGTVTTNIGSAARYNPTFQANNFVYRRVDKNEGTNNRSTNWVLGAGSTNDQLVNNGGSATTIGDYRRGGFYNNRENKWVYMLNVDLQDLLAWNLANGGPLFDPNDSSNGGTVIFLSVVGPNSAGINNYGVRILDTPQLPGYPLNVANPLGITIASDQAFYVEGNYNSATYAPTATGPTGIPWNHPSTALIGDTMNVLSQNWEGTAGGIANDQKSATDLNSSTARTATDTIIYAAFASGVDDPATSTNNYNGGLQNYPRMHELWGDGAVTLFIRGSFVSLTTPLHQNGEWFQNGATYNMYTVPDRQWDFDAQLADLAMLPPMTPSFIYVNQVVMAEDFR